MFKYSLSIVLFLKFFIIVQAQVSTEVIPFEDLIEYEGQRYLMDEIYTISSNQIDELKTVQILNEVDLDDGFMFVMTSYLFNDNSGVVLTSFNGANYFKKEQYFRNIHLSSDEFNLLTKIYAELAEKKPRTGEHYLKAFNEQIIADVSYEVSDLIFILWIDKQNRNPVEQYKWERAYRKHRKFLKVKKRDEVLIEE